MSIRRTGPSFVKKETKSLSEIAASSSAPDVPLSMHCIAKVNNSLSPSSENKLEMALCLLRATALKSVGALELKTPQLDAGVLASMRGMLGTNKVYKFRMVAPSFAFATGAGTSIITYAAFSPAVTTFAEWSSLAALFDECVLDRSYIELTSAINKSATSAAGRFVIGTDCVNNGVTPGSVTAVARLADARSYSIMDWGKPAIIVDTGKMFRGRSWASTGTPGGDGSPPAGLAGQFAIASGTLTTGTTYIVGDLSVIVRLRCRA